MANVTLTINAEGASAIRTLVRMAQSQEKLERSTTRAGRAARGQARDTGRASDAMGKLDARFLSFIKGAAGVGGVAVLLNRVKDAILQVDEALANIARKQSAIGALTTSLSALNPGQGELAVNRAMIAGAKQGILPEDAIASTQVFQSLPENKGSLEKALEDLKTSAALQKLKVDPTNAVDIIKAFKRAGKTSGSAGAALLIASDRSSFSATEISRVGPALEQFTDPTIGLGFASEISGATDRAKLQVLTRRGGQALNLDNEFTKFLRRGLKADVLRSQGLGQTDMARELGFTGTHEVKELLEQTPEGISQTFGADFDKLNEIQKLALTRALIPETRSLGSAVRNRALQRRGLVEIREAQAIGALTSDKNFAQLVETVRLARAAPDTMAADRVQTEFETNPLFRQSDTRDRAVANQKVQQLLNERAKKAGLRRLEVGAYLQANFPFPELLVNQETAEANMAGRVLKFFQERPGFAPLGPLSGVGLLGAGAISLARGDASLFTGPERGTLQEREMELLRNLSVTQPPTVSEALSAQFDATFGGGGRIERLLEGILQALGGGLRGQGSDVPDLDPEVIRKATEALEANTAALQETNGGRLGGGYPVLPTAIANEAE